MEKHKIINKSSKATTALFLSLTFGLGTTLPIVSNLVHPTIVQAQAQVNQFSDVPNNYWAVKFINPLVQRGVIAGFPDGTFKPDAPVTRAQFAAMVQKALSRNPIRPSIQFSDVPSNYWANNAINNAVRMGFMSGYPGQIFLPEQNIPREQVLVALANGLNYTPSNDINTTLNFFNDRNRISNFALSPVAVATEKKLVVNYPNLQQLNPTRNATRAEVAAFIYQALVSQGQIQAINSNYIVSLDDNVVNESRLVKGTKIPLQHPEDKIFVTNTETVPITFTVRRNILLNNQVVIPKGSEVIGEIRPAGNGTKFVADTIELPSGKILSVKASSPVITDTETIRKGMNVGVLLRNAAFGTAAAAAIAGVTGDRRITTGELLLGTGTGVLATLIAQFAGLNQVDLLVIRPNNLHMQLDRDLLL